MKAGLTWRHAVNSSMVVIDASVIVKAVLPNSEQERCQAVIAGIEDKQLVVPALWMYEVSSAFTKAVYFGQLTADEGRAALRQAMKLKVRVIVPDETLNALAFEWTQRLKRASVYDSYYLVVAESIGADFWTADQRLSHALEGVSLPWLHWIGVK
jgi:predicted nucleic acid-binding protein